MLGLERSEEHPPSIILATDSIAVLEAYVGIEHRTRGLVPQGPQLPQFDPVASQGHEEHGQAAMLRDRRVGPRKKKAILTIRRLRRKHLGAVYDPLVTVPDR